MSFAIIDPHASVADNAPGSRTAIVPPVSLVKDQLEELLATSIILTEDWNQMSQSVRTSIATAPTVDQLFEKLQKHGLLSAYQVGRLRAGTTFGLILGNYRILDRLGAGGMGVVFKAEHLVMRRVVAVKVLPISGEQDDRLLLRFRAEIRAVAALHHPNIVSTMDAGSLASNEPNLPTLHYLVMEYLAGQDLEELVQRTGPLQVTQACDLAHQIASALTQAHAHRMVHRDVKPSNILVTGEWQAKLLDFGLAHTFISGLTDPGALIGTVDYMAPEQAENAGGVDIRTDIFSLGATIYFALTGKLPFPGGGRSIHKMIQRRTEPPPSALELRPDLPVELDAVLRKMMMPDPDDRYADPAALMRALFPFLRRPSAETVAASSYDAPTSAEQVPDAPSVHGRILIVDDNANIRQFCRLALDDLNCTCVEASDGEEALAAIKSGEFDVLLLDVKMPGGLGGEDVMAAARRMPGRGSLRVIMMSGIVVPDEMARLMLAGADDYLSKPFSVPQLRARVQAALRLKKAIDQSDRLNRHLRTLSNDLDQALQARDGDLSQLRSALVLSLACVVERRAPETFSHLIRVQRYCRLLAEAAARLSAHRDGVDLDFINALEVCAPLHDIGIIALPDHILLKPSRLEPDEKAVIESHTIIGAEILSRVIERHGGCVNFLSTAVQIARSHHERFDGSGYPDGLKGEAIPLAARILAIADVYDALRSRRAFRPALAHHTAVKVITENSPGQFDPGLLEVFNRCVTKFEAIYEENPD